MSVSGAKACRIIGKNRRVCCRPIAEFFSGPELLTVSTLILCCRWMIFLSEARGFFYILLAGEIFVIGTLEIHQLLVFNFDDSSGER